jgi:glycosyltransferase involved in cell wall biosynthesis
MSRLRTRCAQLFRRTDPDPDIEQELRAFVDERTDQGIAAGLTPDEARRRAQVEAGSPDALSAGIERVIRDPALAERLGAAARRRATDAFSLDAMLRGYGAIYDAVLAR